MHLYKKEPTKSCYITRLLRGYHWKIVNTYGSTFSSFLIGSDRLLMCYQLPFICLLLTGLLNVVLGICIEAKNSPKTVKDAYTEYLLLLMYD